MLRWHSMRRRSLYVQPEEFGRYEDEQLNEQNEHGGGILAFLLCNIIIIDVINLLSSLVLNANMLKCVFCISILLIECYNAQ